MHTKTNRNKNTLAILSIALASALAAPAAFAQSAPANPQDPAAQAAPQSAPPAEAAPQATDPAQKTKTWAELDANGNGSLSVTEAAPIESLAKVFPKADKDGDGELTADEYKAWLAANGGKSKDDKG
jgi:hypothetical protein